ncbi:MAG: hypothetical protein NTZ61_06175, partial [Proteobacteria bacterium]|nr:hypothetical protein [Pseudomonadota bacterium]
VQSNSVDVTKAAPGSNAVFTGWLGACTGTAPTCAILANGHVQVYATFVSSGGGGGTPRCGLLGIEGLLPFAWFALRRWSQRS